MALETLKDLKRVGIYEVKRVTWAQPETNYIEINDECNAITFKIQNGPVLEAGLNGCQIDTMIEVAKIMLEGLNSQSPCRENSSAITKLDEALMWLERRRTDRVKRGVEGTGLANDN